MSDGFEMLGAQTISKTEPGRPLVTFALFAYNQENYIREAVEGAFAQTYEPLEIILSDDCSTDQTFEIMKEMAAAYHGPHHVILNRNPTNLNIGAHVVRVFDMSSGEIIIAAAGDDISAADRTRVIVDAATSNPQAMAFCSAYRILPSGRVVQANPATSINDLLSRRKWLVGATAAYRRVLHEHFDKMLPNVRNEDEVYALRALLLGQILVASDRPLVDYRAGIGVSSENFLPYNPKVFKQTSTRELVFRANLIMQWTRDLSKADRRSARADMYGFRVTNAFLLELGKGNRSMRLFHLYCRTFGAKAAIYQYIGHHYPRLLNAYLNIRYRSKNGDKI